MQITKEALNSTVWHNKPRIKAHKDSNISVWEYNKVSNLHIYNTTGKITQYKQIIKTFSPLTNLLHPAFELISLKEYNKDTFVDLVSSAWIFQRSLYFCLFEENVSTTGTPQKTLKGRYSLSCYNTSHKTRQVIDQMCNNVGHEQKW